MKQYNVVMCDVRYFTKYSPNYIAYRQILTLYNLEPFQLRILKFDLVMIFIILTYQHLKMWNKLKFKLYYIIIQLHFTISLLISNDIVKSNSIVSFKTKINSFDFSSIF